jgi:ABC-2 type transport system permease protein
MRLPVPASTAPALHAEWTKTRTMASTGWLLLAAIALTVAVGAAAAAGTNCPPGVVCQVDPAKVSLTGIDLGQAVVAVVAVLAIGNEYSTGMIHVTLAATPQRVRVLTAKAIVLGALVLPAAAVAVISAALAGQLILPGRGFTPAHGYPTLALTDGPMLRAVLGSVLYLTLVSLLSLGVTCIVRDAAAAMGVALGLLYLFPLLGPAFGPGWGWHVLQIAPMMGGLDIQVTLGVHALPLTPWQGLGVVALWASGALLLGDLALQLRDA